MCILVRWSRGWWFLSELSCPFETADSGAANDWHRWDSNANLDVPGAAKTSSWVELLKSAGSSPLSSRWSGWLPRAEPSVEGVVGVACCTAGTAGTLGYSCGSDSVPAQTLGKRKSQSPIACRGRWFGIRRTSRSTHSQTRPLDYDCQQSWHPMRKGCAGRRQSRGWLPAVWARCAAVAGAIILHLVETGLQTRDEWPDGLHSVEWPTSRVQGLSWDFDRRAVKSPRIQSLRQLKR